MSHARSHRQQASFPARLASLPATAAFARGFCNEHGVTEEDALRMIVIIEELLTNTITHGYGADSADGVTLELALSDDRLTLLYEDSAPPFDPSLQHSSSPNPESEPIEARPVGGLGVHLITGLAAVSRYAFEGGKNRLWLTLEGTSGKART